MNLICCAIHASFETSVFARDSHLDCSNFLLSASNDDGALNDKKPMQIMYFSFHKIQLLLSFQWRFIFADHDWDCVRDGEDETIPNIFLKMVEF